MAGWYRFWYLFWRAVGAVAIRLFHNSQQWSHNSYVKGGKRGRRAKRPLSAVWRWVVASVKRG